MDTPPATSPRRRARSMLLLAAVMAAAGAAGAAWYLRIGQWRESTDNAYLTGNLVTVSAETEGVVLRLAAEENERIEAGAELAAIDDAGAREALDAARHGLALAVRETRALRAAVARARAELRLREITQRLAREEYQRRQRLAARRMLADEELDAARTRAEETAGALETAREALREADLLAGEGPVEQHPRVQAAASTLRSAWLDLQRTRVPAPVAGTVARRRAQPGQRVAAGTPLYSIAERGSAWVEANFKENQLEHMRPGQPVRIRSDLYGDGLELAGRVEGIGPGTGSIYAVLPPQNATGNWIKIVQRVPVRIALDQPLDTRTPLPFGASLHVEVDTHARGGPRLPALPPREAALEATAYASRMDGAGAIVREVLAAEAGEPAP